MPPWDVRRKRPLVVAAISFGVGCPADPVGLVLGEGKGFADTAR